MRLYPESATFQLEFDKVKSLVHQKCQTEYAKSKADDLRIHTRKDFIDRELKQSHEYKQLLLNGIYFPNDTILNLTKDLKLLGIPGALLVGEQLLNIKKLSLSIESIFRWFDAERKTAYSALGQVIEGTYYEKTIVALIDDVIDETGTVKDAASSELQSLRINLYRKRNE
ncbi:MAG: DNA mismatch repair protein MutS, partial [Chitinophagaceae bacterium]